MISTSALTNDVSYFITLRLDDKSNPVNRTNFFVSGATFTVDQSTPLIAIGGPIEGAIYNGSGVFTSSGSAQDSAGLAAQIGSVEIAITSNHQPNHMVERQLLDDRGDHLH